MSLASVLSVVCALLIVGVIMAVVININYITGNIEKSLEVKVYLNDGISTAQQENIYRTLLAQDGVESVSYESKAEALENFAESLGEDNKSIISTYTPENSPLPASYIVQMNDSEKLADVYNVAVALDGVRDADYGEQTVKQLLKFNKFTNTLSWVVFSILSLIAVFIIYNTIKLTVFTRRNEISIMKYVGATDWYIRFPFIIEGATLGVLGAAVSVLLIRNFYYYLIGYIQGTISILPLGSTLAPAGMVMGRISLSFLLYGIFLGALGSSFSLKKFLHV